jgi:DNA-binding MarR family transcriptional regulator
VPKADNKMKIFEAWKKVRDFERSRMPFLNSLIDFDIIIDIGYAEEMDKPLTLKQLLLLIPSSRTTVRRRLAKLVEQGVVVQKKNASDQRSSLLTISASSQKLFSKYAGTITTSFAFPASAA